MNESSVTVRHETTIPLGVEPAALWRELGAEMAGLVKSPSSLTLLVTDRLPAVVRDLEARVPWDLGGPNVAAPYTPDRPDGARAHAKTIHTPDESVVVVDSAILRFGKAAARRLVHHEAQHVWLRQAEDMAWAMHRRAAFTRPVGNIFAFVGFAQSMVDEYRCEAAVSFDVSQANKAMTESPDSWIDVAAVFARAREQHRMTGDLNSTFSLVLGALDRVSSFLGYAAATIARREYSLEQWGEVAPLALVSTPLLRTPAAGRPLDTNGWLRSSRD